MSTEPRHCDDYIRDKTAPMCLRRFLLFKRMPPMWTWKSNWGQPNLFATSQGKRVRVVMASRFGDVGITTDLNADYGYNERVYVSDLTNFSEKP